MMDNDLTKVGQVRGRPYKQDYWQLLRSVYQANEQDDLSSLFCSQLIAAAYQALGLIPKDIPSNNFIPGLKMKRKKENSK